MSALPTEKQIVYLLGELCSRFGFCLSPDQYDGLVATPPSDAESFTEAVFRAEGLGPDSEPKLWRQAYELVARTFRR